MSTKLTSRGRQYLQSQLEVTVLVWYIQYVDFEYFVYYSLRVYIYLLIYTYILLLSFEYYYIMNINNENKLFYTSKN